MPPIIRDKGEDKGKEDKENSKEDKEDSKEDKEDNKEDNKEGKCHGTDLSRTVSHCFLPLAGPPLAS
jgi:hypothetical protein